MDENDIARAEERLLVSIESATAKISKSLTEAADNKNCIDCDEEIPEARRRAAPFARRCVSCQERAER